MQIIQKPMGQYATNCYIVKTENGDIIIDPGVGATDWVMQNCKNPLAVLNTHGHFDHVWSNDELQKKLNVKIYCPQDDEFMLRLNQFGTNLPQSKADYVVSPNETVIIGNTKVTFHHFPGHTPGCSMIEIQDNFFSGDFIFNGSIGRTDFEYSNPKDMINSLEKLAKMQIDGTVYTGHGEQTSISKEQKRVHYWINQLALA